MHVMSPVQQASLEFGKAYIQQIEILHYIDFVWKKMIWTMLCKLWLYFTLALHPSYQQACATLYYYNIFFLWKIKPFLTNLWDFIKYIMQYTRICVTAKLQLASSYTWQCGFWSNGEEKMNKIHSYNFCGAWRKSNITSSVTNYCCQKVISKVTILLLKGVTSNE